MSGYSRSELEGYTLAGRPGEPSLWDIAEELGMEHVKQVCRADIISFILGEDSSDSDSDDPSPESDSESSGADSNPDVPTDDGWVCDVCGDEGRPSSVRFQCTTCADYDLCFACFTAMMKGDLKIKHNLSHELVKINGARSGTKFPFSPNALKEKVALPSAAAAAAAAPAAKKKKPASFEKRLIAEFDSVMTLSEIRITTRPCGIALLIANSNYKHGRPLPNCKNDLEAMKVSFAQLGFTTVCYKDLSAAEMKQVLEETAARTKNHRDAEIFAFYFSGHGDAGRDNDDMLIGVDGKSISAREKVLNQFNTASCQALAGKPKLMILDCCRGARDETGVRVAYQSRTDVYNQTVATKGVSGGGSGHVVHAVNADWWQLHATTAGGTAPAQHKGSLLSPLTHWLQPCLERLAGSKWTLADVGLKINELAHRDLNLGSVGATVPSVTSSIKGKVTFDNA